MISCFTQKCIETGTYEIWLQKAAVDSDVDHIKQLNVIIDNQIKLIKKIYLVVGQYDHMNRMKMLTVFTMRQPHCILKHCLLWSLWDRQILITLNKW